MSRDIDGYEETDPKSPDWADRIADSADLMRDEVQG